MGLHLPKEKRQEAKGLDKIRLAMREGQIRLEMGED
jgi:hypothetical protein